MNTDSLHLPGSQFRENKGQESMSLKNSSGPLIHGKDCDLLSGNSARPVGLCPTVDVGFWLVKAV